MFNYQTFIWISFLFISTLFIVERFFKILDNRPSHEPSFIKDSTSQSITTFILWVTARHLVVLNNYLLFTMMPIVPNWIYQYYPGKINTDIHSFHMKIHRWFGVLCGAEAVIHVWIIFLPCIQNSTVKLLYDGFDESTPWDPVVKSFPIFITSSYVLITWDEIFRIALMTIIFLIVMPLSIWLIKSKYQMAKHTHIVAMMLFTVDNIRKKSHFLSHITTLPLLIFYIILKCYHVFYRYETLILEEKIIIDDQNMVLSMKFPKQIKHLNASIYYLCHKKYNMRYSLHPFTVWYDEIKGSLMFLITKQKDSGWTHEMYHKAKVHDKFYCWGPYYSGLQYTMKNTPKVKTLIATGTGCAYLLHYLQRINEDNYQIHFMTRSNTLMMYFIKEIIKIPHIKQDNIYLYLTGDKDINLEEGFSVPYQVIRKRIQLDTVIKSTPDNGIIFYSGNHSVKKMIEQISSHENIKFISSYTY